MADVHDKKTRSYNMSRIRSRDSKPEMVVRRYLHGQGLRYSLHNVNLPGKPDLALKKYKTVVFVHGCFWHAHENCRYYQIPKTRKEWWTSKLEGNKARDLRHKQELINSGWKVITIWECQLKKESREEALTTLLKSIKAL